MNSILLITKLLGLVEMTSGLVNASFSLPKWQAVKMIFSLHPGVFHLRNCSFQFISHNQFLQAVKHIIITFSFRFYDMFFVYNIIETSCFFVLEEKNNRSILSAIGAY